MQHDEHLTQIALKRQPWFKNEVADGGMLETLVKKGQKFSSRRLSRIQYIEHKNFWTCNPNLHPSWIEHNFEWPDIEGSEYRFGRELFGSNKNYRAAILGRWRCKPQVEHIGAFRSGEQY